MLERARGLSAEYLEAIADLEKRVLAADGGRLKLEWGNLRHRSGTRIDDLLWWGEDRLLGFLGLYAFGGADLELAGMVDPATRRRGIGSALLDAGLDECRARGEQHCLLVVPRPSTAGRELAANYGGELDHSEHALVLRGRPADGPSDPDLTIRIAEPGDADDVVRLQQAGFDWTPPDIHSSLAAPSERERTLIIERRGRTVGTARLTLDGAAGGVYGFTVDPSAQGQGIGRDALRRFCGLLREDGAERVGLEVAVENERALGLYTSLGFTPVTTEDYYRLSC